MNPLQLAGINGFAAARNRLEVQLVSGNLHQHKTLVCIKAFHSLPGLAKVMRHELAGRRLRSKSFRTSLSCPEVSRQRKRARCNEQNRVSVDRAPVWFHAAVTVRDYGGQGRNRTADASLFRAALYRLSYLAISGGLHTCIFGGTAKEFVRTERSRL
jgi:hypothetical protein